MTDLSPGDGGSELVALRWRDVDFTRVKLIAKRAVSSEAEASSTKSRRAREVPLRTTTTERYLRARSASEMADRVKGAVGI